MTSLVELGWPHYEFQEITNMRDVREIFPDGIANRYNWVFLSNQCFHGTNETLDKVEEILLGQDPIKPIDGRYWSITILILCTRTTVVKYGYINVTIDDVEYLRRLVRTTLDIIKETQTGNT